MTKILEGIGEYRVHSGDMKWSGLAATLDEALDKALNEYQGASLGELIRIDAPKAIPAKKTHVAFYASTANQLRKRGLLT